MRQTSILDTYRLRKIHSCPEMMNAINEIGFLPLLPMGIRGWSADELTDAESGYVELPDGGWEWALWKWKGDIIRETGCAYGKFFDRKAAFISKEWWPHFCNLRRSLQPAPQEESIDGMVLQTLREHGSMVARDLRKACGFTGTKMRGKFDTRVARLQMEGYMVTEDFVYPLDRHGKEYGWGWSLLTTPEALFGRDACRAKCPPQESYERMSRQLRKIFPTADDTLFSFLLKGKL